MLASPFVRRAGVFALVTLAAVPVSSHALITPVSRNSSLSVSGGDAGASASSTSFLPFSESLATLYGGSLPIGNATQNSSITATTISLAHTVRGLGGGSPMQGFYRGFADSSFDVTFTIASPSSFTLTGNFFSGVIGDPIFYSYSGLFTRVDQPATLFNLTTQPFYNPVPQGFILSDGPINVSGSLSPGTYRLSSSFSTSGSIATGLSNRGGLSLVLTIPTPSATLPLAFGLLTLAFRRKR